MGDTELSEQRLDRLRLWLRSDYRRAFESGLSWGWPRCRTEEERLLFPLLLAALSPYSAVVAHRRMPEDGAVSFIISLSRETPSGVERIQWRVADRESDVPAGDEHAILLSREQVRTVPWEAASGVVAAIQNRLFGLPAPEE